MNKKGFTLLELLVVVLIIGILAAIALPQYKYIVWKTRYSTLKDVTKSLFEAESRYYLVNNVYTDDLTTLDIEISDTNVVCRVNVSNEDVYCSYIHNGKQTLYYGIKIGSFGTSGYNRRCFAFSTDRNDVLNKVCKEETGHEPYNNCTRNRCSYKYEE